MTVPRVPAGIEATSLFWPAKPRASGRPVLFQLHLWDCGDGALRKFEHLLPVSGGRILGCGTPPGPRSEGVSPSPGL